MSNINNTFKRLATDGRIGKREVETIVRDALDGKGVTKTEAAQLKKLRERYADSFTSQGAKALDNFLARMNRSWSKTKEVHLPNVDLEKVNSLLDADPRARIYVGRSGSDASSRAVGGEASSSRSRARGGEASRSHSHASGGEASRSRSHASGGEANSSGTNRGSRTSNYRSSGGESSSLGSYRSNSGGGSYGRSYGGE